MKYFTGDSRTSRTTLCPNLPSGNKCGNANFSQWSSDKIDKGVLFCPGANIILFSSTKWGTSDISEVSLVAIWCKLPGSSASSKFSSSKVPLIFCVTERFEKSKISPLVNPKEILCPHKTCREFSGTLELHRSC